MSYRDIEDSMDIMPSDDIDEEIIMTTVQIAPSTSPEEDRIADYQLIRSVLGDAMAKGSQALAGALKAAEESKHPRAYEVAGMLTKTVSSVCGDLMDLHKSMSDIRIKEPKQNDDPNDPSVFTGTAGDLLEILDEVDEKQAISKS